MSSINVGGNAKTTAPASKPVDQEGAMSIANGFILRHFRDRFIAGPPHNVALRGKPVWVASILLTYPGRGIVGEVGMIAIDARSGAVCAHTLEADLEAAAHRLTRGKWSEIEAAFHSTRKS